MQMCKKNDALSLISYSDIENDKYYTNISEYFLKDNAFVKDIFDIAKVDFNNFSDYDFFRTFVEICIRENKTNSFAYISFVKCLERMIGKTEISLNSCEEIWRKTFEKLIDKSNSLRKMIEKSGLDSLGVPVTFDMAMDKINTLLKIGNTKIVPVFCPFGTKNQDFEFVCANYTIESAEKEIDKRVEKYKKCALFSEDFIFVKPNEYAYKKAFSNYKNNKKISNSDIAMLNSQFARILFESVSKHNGELYIFLPCAKKINSMPYIMDLFDYIETCNFEKVKVKIFANDAVSISFALSICTKGYKKTDAETCICGNGIVDIKDDYLEYLGLCKKENLTFASLSKSFNHYFFD